MRHTTTIAVHTVAVHIATVLATRNQSWGRDHRHPGKLAGLPKLAAVIQVEGAGLLALGGSCQRVESNWPEAPQESTV